jgi:hypothetical protein
VLSSQGPWNIISNIPVSSTSVTSFSSNGCQEMCTGTGLSTTTMISCWAEGGCNLQYSIQASPSSCPTPPAPAPAPGYDDDGYYPVPTPSEQTYECTAAGAAAYIAQTTGVLSCSLDCGWFLTPADPVCTASPCTGQVPGCGSFCCPINYAKVVGVAVAILLLCCCFCGGCSKKAASKSGGNGYIQMT